MLRLPGYTAFHAIIARRYEIPIDFLQKRQAREVITSQDRRPPPERPNGLPGFQNGAALLS